MATKKEPRTTLLEYLGFMGKKKSSVSKDKADILAKAEKDIREQQGMRTQRSIDVSTATGVKSDPDRNAEEIAKKARRALLMLRR